MEKNLVKRKTFQCVHTNSKNGTKYKSMVAATAAENVAQNEVYPVCTVPCVRFSGSFMLCRRQFGFITILCIANVIRMSLAMEG